jgi:FdhD protein
MVSERASVEIRQKALVAGIPIVAAVSTPLRLTVALARKFNMTLVGFLWEESCNIYAGAQRIGS